MTKRALALLKIIALIVCLSGPLGCSTVKSNSDYNPSVDFSLLKTFAWLPDQPQGQTRVLHTNGLRLDRVKNAIDRSLETKGLRPVAQAEADFLIRSLVTEEVVPTEAAQGHSGNPGPGPGPTDTTPKSKRSQRYENVALIVDFVEPQDQELIWRGTGEKRIERNTSADVREAAIEELVSKILLRYPPAMN